MSDYPLPGAPTPRGPNVAPPGAPTYPPPPAGAYPQPGYPQPGYGPPGVASPGYGPPFFSSDRSSTPWGPAAAFWPRFGAYLLDLVFSWLPALLLLGAMIGLAPTEPGGRLCRNEIDQTIEPCDELTTTGTWMVLGGLALFALLVSGYYSLFIGRFGRTIGQRLAGLRVVDEMSGQPIGVLRAFGRFLAAFFLSRWCLFLGYLWMLWDPAKQTWHDKITRARVISRR